MKTVSLHVVDSFTTKPFSGNPAAVALLTEPISVAAMQKIALEMNLSETAFLQKIEPSCYGIRWFTPGREVDLCGHATLAAAHWLWESGTESGDEIRFSCQVGVLSARRSGHNEMSLDFPSEPAEEASELSAVLSEILHTKVIWAGKNRMDYMVEITSEKALLELTPDFARMATLPCRGLLVTVRSTTPEAHFKSRTFFPSLDVNEDPVCGSAHCCFAPYWAAKLGTNQMIGYQASPRGGFVQVTLKGERVELRGSAVTVSRVEFLVPLDAGYGG